MDTPQQSPTPYTPPVATTPSPITTPPPPGTHTGVLVGGLVAVIVLAAAAYYFFGRTTDEVAVVSPSPSEVATPTPTVDPTAGWKTYSNTNFGFSLNYPADMDPLTATDQPYPGSTTMRMLGISGKMPSLELLLRANNPGTGANGVASPSEGSIVVDGITINYRTGKIMATGETVPGIERLWIGGFSVASDGYDFQFTSPDGSDQTTLVLQILSTFKFTR